MSRLFVTFVLLFVLVCSSVVRNLTAHVDTRIGTGGAGYGIGQLNPGAQFPFGLMRVGPDTSLGLDPLRVDFELFGGYYYDDTFIECFSHTHLVGAGEGDLQNVGVMLTRNLKAIDKNDGYRSSFSHGDEIALPGYYAAELVSAHTRAEVTVSGTHGAMHRYTCRPTPDGAPCILVIDVCHGFEYKLGVPGSACKEAQIVSVIPIGTGKFNISVRVLDSGDFTSDQPKIHGMWFYWTSIIEFSVNGTPVPVNATSWVNQTLLPKVTLDVTTSGSLGVVLSAPAPGPNTTLTVVVRAAISVVSVASAAANLLAEQHVKGNWMLFDDCVQCATNEWESQLSLIAVAGGAADSPAQRTTFMTALYHSLLTPTTYDGVDGAFVDMLLRVDKVPPGTHFMSDLSIWDVYRTQMPLLLWLRPDVALDVSRTMLFIANQTGQFPKWVLGNVETDTMVGHHSAVILLDWWTKGLKGMNPAVPSMVSQHIDFHTQQRLGPLGYIPLEDDERGSSVTLDEALDCGAVVRCANLGLCPPPTATLRECALAYRRVFDVTRSLVLPRYRNGTFLPLDPYTPYPLEKHYTEGNAAQYRWYVPHNLTDLIALFPSPSAAADALDDLFTVGLEWPLGNALPNWGYWAGNEIDILAPWVFAFIGPEYAHLTQRWVAEILGSSFPPTPGGIPGNDDYGAMSAWVVWAMVGLYPVSGTTDYVLTTPQFDTATISCDPRGAKATPWGGTTLLTVVAHDRPAQGPAFVARAALNGRWMNSTVVSHADLLGSGAAGRLDVYLSATPVVFGKTGGKPYIPSRERKVRV